MKRILLFFVVSVLAFGASAAEWRVTRGADGVPHLMKDGKCVEPWFFSFARMTEGNALEIDSVTNEIRMAKAAGTRIYSVSMLPGWGTAAEREKAVRQADRLMARILAADPDAYVMPRVQMSEAPWLMRELTDRNLSSDGSREQPSVSAAHYRCECRDAWGDPAVVLRPAKAGRAMGVFCGPVDLPPEAIRALARLAGADVRVSRNAGVDIRGGFASITAAEAGPYDLKVNGEKDWFDAVSGEPVGKGPVLRLEFQGPDTRVFVDETVWSRYRKGVTE